jgi:hypothetical protein
MTRWLEGFDSFRWVDVRRDVDSERDSLLEHPRVDWRGLQCRPIAHFVLGTVVLLTHPAKFFTYRL